MDMEDNNSRMGMCTLVTTWKASRQDTANIIGRTEVDLKATLKRGIDMEKVCGLK